MEHTWASGAIELFRHADSHIDLKTAFDRRIAFISIDNSVETSIRVFLSLPTSKSGINVPRRDVKAVENSFPGLVSLLWQHVGNRLIGIGGSLFLPFVSGTFNSVAPHSGNFQAILAANDQGIPYGGTLAQSVATTPGTTYTIDFFAASNSGARNGTLTVTFGGNTVFSHLFNAMTGYSQFTVNATAATASTLLNFTWSGFGYLYLDDISVVPAGVGVPDGGTTVSLLGCALLGLAALRRKLSC